MADKADKNDSTEDANPSNPLSSSLSEMLKSSEPWVATSYDRIAQFRGQPYQPSRPFRGKGRATWTSTAPFTQSTPQIQWRNNFHSRYVSKSFLFSDHLKTTCRGQNRLFYLKIGRGYKRSLGSINGFRLQNRVPRLSMPGISSINACVSPREGTHRPRRACLSSKFFNPAVILLFSS